MAMWLISATNPTPPRPWGTEPSTCLPLCFQYPIQFRTQDISYLQLGCAFFLTFLGVLFFSPSGMPYCMK